MCIALIVILEQLKYERILRTKAFLGLLKDSLFVDSMDLR